MLHSYCSSKPAGVLYSLSESQCEYESGQSLFLTRSCRRLLLILGLFELCPLAQICITEYATSAGALCLKMTRSLGKRV